MKTTATVVTLMNIELNQSQNQSSAQRAGDRSIFDVKSWPEQAKRSMSRHQLPVIRPFIRRWSAEQSVRLLPLLIVILRDCVRPGFSGADSCHVHDPQVSVSILHLGFLFFRVLSPALGLL